MALIKKFRIKEFKNKKPIAKLEKVSLSYDKRQILDNINFNLNSGEIIGLLGPNGAGKSTMFNLLIGLIKPDFGKVIIENEDVTNFPIYERQEKISSLISKFALDNVQEIKAKFLSGGQGRKLVICMALLGDPKILLCDEIFAALDVLTIHMLKEILVNLQNENPKICIVVCEHQARELLSIVDRALILSNCKIIAEGSPNNLIKDEKAKSQYFGDFFKN